MLDIYRKEGRLVDLLKDSPQKLFLKYLVPSVSATMVTSIYILADSIMIGKGIGELAIAALNIILPLFNIFFGTGALFGIGGAVLFSVSMGNGDPDRAKRYFTLATLFTAAFALCYLVVGNVFLEPILTFLGATDLTWHYAYDYARWLMVGAPVFAFSMLLQSFVRNDKNPKLAMVAVIAGGVLNTFLDWLFIYPMQLGMTGAIVASVIGTGVTCLILCLHFFRKECNLRFSFKKLRSRYSKEIVQYGASSFLTELSGGVLIFVLNQQALLYAGELGVTVYSVLTNSAYIVNAFSNGIAQAAQPIIATNFGAKAQDRIDALKGIGLRTALIAGCTFAALGLLFPQAVVYIFVHPTEAILELAPMAVRIYFIGFIGAALNIFFTSYFQATLQPSKALTVCMLRGLILSALFAYTLPLVLDIIGIWASILLAEFITLGIAVAMDRKKK